MLPIRPFRGFLFGFLHFSGVYISIASNISIAFFLIATLLQHPRDSTYEIERLAQVPCLLSILRGQDTLPCRNRIDTLQHPSNIGTIFLPLSRTEVEDSWFDDLL